MATKWLRNMFGAEKDDATETLDVLARTRVPIQVEIEGSQIRFISQLSLKEKSVIVAKPLTLGAHELQSGGHVRIRWSGAGRREMRLEVAVPHFNLPNGSACFVCRAPDGSAIPKRKHERYDTSRFTNLRLEVGTGSYRVLDLCSAGCRVAMPLDMNRSQMALGREVEDAVLAVGKDSKIVFDQLIPRSQNKGRIGCEFRVKQDGQSPKVLARVLTSVQNRQFDWIHAS